MVVYWCRVYVARMVDDGMGYRCDFSLCIRISLVTIFFGRRGVQKIEKENGRTLADHVECDDHNGNSKKRNVLPNFFRHVDPLVWEIDYDIIESSKECKP